MSIGYVPQRPEGTDSRSRFMQWVYDTLVNRMKMIETPGALVNRTTRGMSVIPRQRGGGGGSVAVAMYKLKDVSDDYLTCHTWDGTTEGSSNVYIAKERRHRCSITSETILGSAHTYTYSAGPSETWAAGTKTTYNRTRTDSSETQRIVPPWIENEIIQAIDADTGVVRYDEINDPGHLNPIKITLQVIGRSCQWAKITT